VHAANLDPFTEVWLICVDEECQLNCIDCKAHIKNGKPPEAMFQDYYTHYFYYYTLYFSRLTRILVAVSTSYTLPDLCTLILCVITSVGNIREAAIAV
jgi:hypothetical protein